MDRLQTGMMFTSSQIKVKKSKKTSNNEFFKNVNFKRKTKLFFLNVEQILVTFRLQENQVCLEKRPH